MSRFSCKKIDIKVAGQNIELKNVEIDCISRIRQYPNPENPFEWNISVDGDPIVIITQNMPGSLRDKLIEQVKEYCQHYVEI